MHTNRFWYVISRWLFSLCFVMSFYASIALADTIETDGSSATLSFAGEHAGRTFTGVFKQWSAYLALPPNTSPSIQATFSLDSAETGNAMYDETLKEEDWFNVENTPDATFSSTSIELNEDGYVVEGILAIRNIEQSVEFVLSKNASSLDAKFDIDRLAFDIGKDSDPDAEWVSKTIQMMLSIPL